MRGQPRLLTISDLNIDCGEFAATAKRLIKSEMTRRGKSGFILWLDGGLGSTTVVTLAAQAVGIGRIKALLFPEAQSGSLGFRRAQNLVARLNLRHKVLDVSPMLAGLGVGRARPLGFVPFEGLRRFFATRFGHAYVKPPRELPGVVSLSSRRAARDPWVNRAVAIERARVRQRAVALYYHAEMENLLTLGSVDKTELSLGLFVHHGDTAYDVAPLSTLYRTQVRQLGNYLGLAPELVNEAASSEASYDIIYEGANLDLPFDLIDRVLHRLQRGQDPTSIAMHLGLGPAEVEHIAHLTRRAEHLRSHSRPVPYP